MKRIPVIEAFVVIAIALVLMALLFPAGGGGRMGAAGKAQAKNDVVQIATATVAFETEYNRLPGTGRQVVDESLLAILTGSNTTINPRKIVFIEVQPFKKNKGGLTNGVWLDPWGAPYQIAFATGTNQFVQAGTNNTTVKKRVAVWNDPHLGADPPWWQSANTLKKERRYVTSWD